MQDSGRDERAITRRALLLGGSAVIVGASEFLLPSSAMAASAGADIYHGSRLRAEVALTFHGGGDLSIARKILAIAKKDQAPITVMAIGIWLNSNSTIGQEIIDAGNEIGNHTLNHKTMTTLSLKEAKYEISKGKLALANLVGSTGRWFRPSGTQKSNGIIRAAAGASGYAHCISYDVDSRDYQDPPAKTILSNVTKSIQNGSIVSLHLGHSHTVTALPLILQALADRKLAPVTISELLRA
ncbi:MAG: polysaccharide deacetylase family protein [Actinobacteria bacterium]|nr:polysaccharide deacetylase family protein [Actinomycetota bacterium]